MERYFVMADRPFYRFKKGFGDWFDVVEVCGRSSTAAATGAPDADRAPPPVGCTNWYVAVSCWFVPKLGSVL